MRLRRPRGQRGFSLLEVLVAFSIMGMALGALYNVVGGSVRATHRIEQASRASLVARSLLALYPYVPAAGISAQGSSPDGLHWSVSSEPFQYPFEKQPARPLHQIRIVVSGADGGRAPDFTLQVVVPEGRS